MSYAGMLSKLTKKGQRPIREGDNYLALKASLLPWRLPLKFHLKRNEDLSKSKEGKWRLSTERAIIIWTIEYTILVILL